MQEARNTERYGFAWGNSTRLRDHKVQFVSAGNLEMNDSDGKEDNVNGDGVHEDGQPETVKPASKAEQDEIPPERTSLPQEVSNSDFDCKHTGMIERVGRMEIVAEPLEHGPATSVAEIAQPSSPPRSTSKSSVASEEEIIVFGGRRGESRNLVRRPEIPSPTTAPTLTHEMTAVRNEELSPSRGDKSALSTPDSVFHRPARSSEDLPSAKSALFEPNPNFGRRRGRRRGPSQHEIEEEALMQDYIANIKDDETEDDKPEVSVRNEHFRFFKEADGGNVKVQTSSSGKLKMPDIFDEHLEWSSGDLEDFDDMSTTDDEIVEVSRVYADRLRPSGFQYLVTGLGKGPDDARWILAEKMTSTSATTEIRFFEERRKAKPDLQEGISDDSSTDSDEGEREVLDDENERLFKLTASMTDAQIAQALDMQDKLGMPTNEVLLFNGQEGSEFANGDDFIPFSSKQHTSSQKGSKRNLRKNDSFPSAGAFADALEQDPYNGFDVMDFDRPSLKPKPKGRKSAGLPFELEDEDLAFQLQQSWDNDRSKKASRKKEREEARQAGLLGSKAANGRVDLHTKYQISGMNADQIRSEIRSFMVQEIEALALAPMAADMRASVHRLARALNLKSHSQGKGDGRFPILTKTPLTHHYTIDNIGHIDAFLNQRKIFGRNTGSFKTSKLSSGGPKTRRSGGGGVLAGASYMDGEVVGASAPEIGADNRGRAMLEKMGWSSGMGIGKVGNKGSTEVIKHVVKNTKAGLG
jgi:R3H domain/G-patch domain